MSPDRVPLAIVGIGCLFPKADGPGAFWANVKNGVDCVGPVPATHWSPDDYLDADPKSPDMTYAARGAFLDPVEFNPLEFGISPVDLEATDTSQLLGLVAARQALNDAGYTPDRKFDKNRVSVILGVTGTLELVIPLGARLGHPKWKKALANAGVDAETSEKVVQEIADSYVPWQENSFPGLLGNVVAGRIANKLDLGGTNCVVDAACASSLSAIHLAGLELAAGRCDVAVTGGVDTFNDIFMFMCFSKTPALSKTGDAKPFDADSDGTILGEGLGVVVLKRLADAERDGDRIYAVLKAIGSSSDGKGNAVYAPSADGQRRCLQNAYDLADVSPATIELVEAHGTGTKVGDTVEATALAGVYRQAKPEGTWCAVGSVKSMIGHTKAAAGAAGLIKAALALYNKVLPPTLKVKSPVEPLKPGASPLYVNTEKRPWLPRADHPRRAGMSAFGFGGSNFHAVLEEHSPNKLAPDWDGGVQLAAVSADSPTAILTALDAWPADLSWPAFCARAAESRASFKSADKCRLVFVVPKEGNFANLAAVVRAKLKGEPAPTPTEGSGGAFFGSGPAPGGLAVLFPGQGSQRVGMLRDLACTFPEMLDALTGAETDWAGPKRLSDFVYPHPVFAADARADQETELRATAITQPALGAIEVGAWNTLKRFGVKGEAFAGHSYGELVALWAAGVIREDGLHLFSRERGRLMAASAGPAAGSMLAVLASPADVATALREEGIELTIANVNSPTQCVLSGTTPKIADAEVVFQKRKVRSTRLPVAAAFHSPLVAKASVPFRETLEEVPFRRPTARVFANTTAKEYPTSSHDARDLLANQLARPVDFVGQIQAMARSGVRSFLEVGPGSVLTRLAGDTLKTGADWANAECFALDGSNGRRSGMVDLANALAWLASRGHAVDLTKWEEGQTYPVRTAKPGLTVPISGANYVRPKPAAKEPTKPAAKPAPKPVDSTPPTPVSPVVPVAAPAPAAAPRKVMSETPPPPAPSSPLALTQQSLLAFQRMQEDTARLHQQFLNNQQAALATLHALVAQQQAMLTGHPVAAMPVHVPPPAPVYTPPATPQAAYAPPPVAAPVAPPPPPRPATPPPLPKTPPPLPKPAAPDSSAILLSVVAEKTGYPADMLGLDMTLDADLGIDSIKRVEILSALQEKLPNAPEVKPEHLGTLHTLRDIVAFLGAAPVEPLAASRVEPPAKPQAAPAPTKDVEGILLGVVAEKTGYPADMLGLDMALDADLGIDSIKRVEILSAIQEQLPGAPEVKPEHLGTLHTLRDIAAFLGGSSPPIASPPVAPAPEAPRPLASAPTLASAESGRDTPAEIEPIEVAPPVEPPATVVRSVVRPFPISPDGVRRKVTLERSATIWVIADPSSFAAKVAQSLDAVGLRPQVIGWNDLPSAYEPKGLGGLVLVAPEAAGPDDLPLRAFQWLKRCAPALAESAKGAGAVFATVTRLDGSFGFGTLEPLAEPIHGALAGLAKTASHEWPKVSCKAIDVDPHVSRHVANDIVEEILTAGPVEVGLTPKGRFSLGLIDAPLAPGETVPLSPGDVVVVTGGGRGVTAESLLPLARAASPKFVLLGRTPVSDGEPDWLAALTDEGAIKQAIVAHMDHPATPREVGEEYKRIVAQREVRRNVQRLREAGATAEYLSVDVQDAGALTSAVADVRNRLGPIAAIIHGAGVLADRKIEDLTDEQFRHVYDTKVNGLRNLLTATEQDSLKAVVLFSSSTGRFGRTGQLAYAAANEVLNKTAQRLGRAWPGCRTVAINWGPWAGGMVTPGLAKVFANEGIGLIPLAAGGETLLRELSAPDKAAEVVVIARPEGQPHPAAELDAAQAALTPVFERKVSLFDHEVLRSHVINDKAVIPLVLHAEWMAHAALHGNPGLRFLGFDELRIFQGVQLDEANPAIVRVLCGRAARKDGQFVVPVEVRGTKNRREVTHSRADVVLTTSLPDAPLAGELPATNPYTHTPAEAYEYLLFHGPALRALERIDGIGDAGAVTFTRTTPSPAEWMTNPVRGAWLADPLALDAAFQALILWSYQAHKAASLPCYVGGYRQFQRTFPADGVTVAVRVTKDNNTTARADVEFIGPDGRLVAKMTDAEHVIDASLNEAFRRGRTVPTTAAARARR